MYRLRPTTKNTLYEFTFNIVIALFLIVIMLELIIYSNWLIAILLLAFTALSIKCIISSYNKILKCIGREKEYGELRKLK